MRLTVGRERSMPSATSSSVNLWAAMYSARCIIRTNVHGAHIAVNTQCAPGVLYLFFAVVHHVYMTKNRVIPRPKKPLYRPTFLRQWRDKRGYTLEDVGEAVGISHAQLGRIERGLQPYNQGLLEALATHYSTDVASLLMRDPSDPEGMWSIWDKAKTGQREIIVDLAKTVLNKTGTNG